MNKDGTENVNRFMRPFEMRLFDLRKQSYTIQLTNQEQNAMTKYETRYHRNRSIF